MKKTLFALMALTLVCAIALSSCSKKEEDKEEPVPPTKTELLTQVKGWVLTSATSVPKFEPLTGDPDEDLFKSFFEECEIDDINIFKPNNDMVLKYGGKLCDGQTGTEEFLGKWKFIEGKEDVIQFYLVAYFEDNGNYSPLEAKIVNISETSLQLRVPIFEHKKSVEPKYQFLLTYQVAQ